MEERKIPPLPPREAVPPCPACGREPEARVLPGSVMFRGREVWVMRCFKDFPLIHVEGGQMVVDPGYGHDFIVESDSKQGAEKVWRDLFSKIKNGEEH